jgi:hypothetical protein
VLARGAALEAQLAAEAPLLAALDEKSLFVFGLCSLLDERTKAARLLPPLGGAPARAAEARVGGVAGGEGPPAARGAGAGQETPGAGGPAGGGAGGGAVTPVRAARSPLVAALSQSFDRRAVGEGGAPMAVMKGGSARRLDLSGADARDETVFEEALSTLLPDGEDANGSKGGEEDKEEAEEESASDVSLEFLTAGRPS